MKFYLQRLMLVLVITSESALSAGHILLEDSKIGYYMGANIRYYKEYGAEKDLTQNKDLTSLPVRRCDPLPLDSIGGLKVFFTSAVEGHVPLVGQGIVIPNSESHQKFLVVRAKAESSGTWGQAYIGYNPNEYENNVGTKKIYKSVLFALQTKSTRHTDDRTVHLFSGAEYLNNMMIGLEVKKHLATPEEWNWNGEAFQRIFQGLVPKREGFHIDNQNIYLSTCYWTKDENKLKKRKYPAKT